MEQTVETPVYPAGSGSANGVACAAPTLAPNDPLNPILLSLIPVRGARELLVGLSESWRLWARAEMAVVAIASPQLGRTSIGLARANEPPKTVESDFQACHIAQGLGGLLATSFPILPVGPPAAMFSFPISGNAALGNTAAGNATVGKPLAGIWLYSCDVHGLPGQDLPGLCNGSGRLVDQALLVERLLAGHRVLEAEKAEAIAEFAAGAGHEINNPLATIAGRVQILLREERDAERRQLLATIGAQALRVRDMIGDLMLFGRPPQPQVQRMLLDEQIRSIIDRFNDQSAMGSRIILHTPIPLFATVDPTQLAVVVNELLCNAREAAGAGGEAIRVTLERATIDAKAYAVISVTDCGPGLTENDRRHLFDPYYSGRDAGRGLGFGLCKCQAIVAAHGGWIEVESVPRMATTFRTFWPDAAVAGRLPAAPASKAG